MIFNLLGSTILALFRHYAHPHESQVITDLGIKECKGPEQDNYRWCHNGAGEGTLTPGLILGKDAL